MEKKVEKIDLSVQLVWDTEGEFKPNFFRHKIIRTINGLPDGVKKATLDDFKNSNGQIIAGKPFLFQFFFPIDPTEYCSAVSDPEAFLIADDCIHLALSKGLVWVRDLNYKPIAAPQNDEADEE